MAKAKRVDFLIGPKVRRNVHVELRSQRIKGKTVPVLVEAGELETSEIPGPPPKEELNGFRPLGFAIALVVRKATKPKTRLYSFDPPLALTIEVSEKDIARADKGPDGKPRFHIFTCHQAKSRDWKWQKIVPTDIVEIDGKLAVTAKIWTLHPKDPEGVGSP